MLTTDNDLDIVQSRRRENGPDRTTRHFLAVRPPDLRTPKQVVLESEYLAGIAWAEVMPDNMFDVH